MRALIIGSNFYNYREMIATEMRQYQVDIVNQIPNHYYGIKKLIGDEKASRIREKHLNKEIKHLSGYELVLVLVGEFLTYEILHELRDRNRNATFVLYLWDDISRIKNYSTVAHLYDKIFTFSPEDASKYNISFLPLFFFYTNQSYKNKREKYDIYSAMGRHSDRIDVSKKVIDQANQLGLRCSILVKVNMVDWIKTLFQRIDVGNNNRIHYITKSIKYKQNIYNMRNARAILDIQHDEQIGLTMRTIECIGLGKKLITTNKNVSKYDFYNPNNVLIIDRTKPKLDRAFFESPFFDIPDEIRKKYAVSTWVRTILGNEENTFIR